MSGESDALTHFVATVMGQIYGLRTAGQELVETLNLRALAGDRTAKDTLANPWNSSVSPTRRVPEIETQLDRVHGVLEEVGPKFLAAALERDRLEKQREYHLDRDRTVCESKTIDTASSEPAYTRLLTMLRKAGVSDRDAARVSMKAVLDAGRIIKRQTEDRWCDTLVSLRELSRAGLMQHVSIPRGWSVTSGEVWYVERSGHYWHQDPEDGTFRLEAAPDPYFAAENCQTILPTPLTIDPPGLPRAWTPETDADMHPVLWDAMPDEVYYRSFIREIEEGENIALYWPCALPEGEEPLPPFATLESMLRFDADFYAAYQRADRRARVLDGHRAGLDGKTVDDLATSEGKHDRELFEWARPVAKEVMFDTHLWDAWRPWGTLLSALRDYLQYREFRGRDCLVSAWAYYLKGRLAQSDNDLPLFVRRGLFDWLMLPVPSLLAPAIRILVPRDQLTEGARAGCPQPLRRDAATL